MPGGAGRAAYSSPHSTSGGNVQSTAVRCLRKHTLALSQIWTWAIMVASAAHDSVGEPAPGVCLRPRHVRRLCFSRTRRDADCRAWSSRGEPTSGGRPLVTCDHWRYFTQSMGTPELHRYGETASGPEQQKDCRIDGYPCHVRQFCRGLRVARSEKRLLVVGPDRNVGAARRNF